MYGNIPFPQYFDQETLHEFHQELGVPRAILKGNFSISSTSRNISSKSPGTSFMNSSGSFFKNFSRNFWHKCRLHLEPVFFKAIHLRKLGTIPQVFFRNYYFFIFFQGFSKNLSKSSSNNLCFKKKLLVEH